MKLKILPAFCAMLLLVGCSTKNVAKDSKTSSATEIVEPIIEKEEKTTGPYVFDFTTLTADKSSALDVDGLSSILQNNVISSIENVDSIYLGAGTGGCHANEFGLIKMGTSKKHGMFTLNLIENVKVSKITVKCHDFYAKSDSYPTNSNYLIINGIEKLAPYNENGTGEDLVFELNSATNIINFDSNLRIYLFSITLE